MNLITITWIVLPFLAGFTSYLLPRLDRYLALLAALVSAGYGFYRILDPQALTLQLVDSFGVTLMADSLSGFFVLTNAIVTAAVILYSWNSGKTAFFYTQATILHGSVNAVLISADFISLYVALEVISISAFLLIAYPRTNRSIWVGLRYLFVSNTAMLFYLIGAVLVYQSNHSFAYAGLQQAPTEAIALILLGLFTKGGIFVSGLWLPLTHAESETPVSALLSGIVIKAGVFPLIRCALIVDNIGSILAIFSVGTALLGVAYAIFETDTKRMLALSTISQLGFVIAAPAAAGFYALSHGLAKASLFLIAGNLPSRQFDQLRQTPMRRPIWIALLIASLSIAGFPLLAGFGAKALALKPLESWHSTILNIAAVGTTIAFAKFIFLPVGPAQDSSLAPQKGSGLGIALIILSLALVLANGVDLSVYTLSNVIKALVILGLGWAAYFLIIRRYPLRLPRMLEQFDHLIGMMTLMLSLLSWMVLA